jgi:electron transport complex protein RnfB
METFMQVIAVVATAAIAVAVLALIAGKMGRPFYSRFDRIRRALPGFDCGACGFPQCIDYAAAAADGAAALRACVPGGPGTAHEIADVLGTHASIGEPMMAVVHCNGGKEAARSSRYEGIEDCRAALLIGSGTKACIEGCLGLGSCVRACPFGALSLNGDALAVVDSAACTGCGTCLPACPRNLLSLVPRVHKIYLACSNHDAGPQVAENCSVGCTACGACEAVTPSGAIIMTDCLPRLDYGTPGENFLAASHVCPSQCFVDIVKVRPKANIDTKCDGCGECIPLCPVAGTITGERGKRHVIRKDLCIGCGRCLTACHVRAIALWGGLGYGSEFKNAR